VLQTTVQDMLHDALGLGRHDLLLLCLCVYRSESYDYLELHKLDVVYFYSNKVAATKLVFLRYLHWFRIDSVVSIRFIPWHLFLPLSFIGDVCFPMRVPQFCMPQFCLWFMENSKTHTYDVEYLNTSTTTIAN